MCTWKSDSADYRTDVHSAVSHLRSLRLPVLAPSVLFWPKAASKCAQARGDVVSVDTGVSAHSDERSLILCD